MRAMPLLLVLPLIAAASTPVPREEPVEVALKRAQAEQSTAEAEAAKLQLAADEAQGEAARLRAEQAAAAQAIDAVEARITASEMELRLASAYLDVRKRRLAEQRQPVASLLAGLAVMAQRPPLLAIAERGSTDEFVRIRVLLDSTLPVIRQRTAAVSAELREGQQLERAADVARAQLLRGRKDLLAKRGSFAQLERRAAAAAAAASGQALSAGDTAIAAGESVDRLTAGEAGTRDAARLAAALVQDGAAPPRPGAPDTGSSRPPLAYRLPADAPVREGLGSVSASGVRSRGLTLATPRGTAVAAPADGVVRFSGPFRSYDGVVIIDHGGGWVSLLVNVGSAFKVGQRVRLGDAIGRTLGPLVVELSQNGRRVSPALIAGSSASLSKNAKGG